MPQIGDISSGKGIGKTTRASLYQKYVYVACPDCGEGHWAVRRNTRKPNFLGLCSACQGRRSMSNRIISEATRRKIGDAHRGDKNCNWKGGRCKHNRGYIIVKLQPDDFFYPMALSSSYVLEHRLVMAKSLGRCLHDWEMVHHKNGIRDDNRIENLQLLGNDRHSQITILERKIDRLLKGQEELKKELRLLRLENKLLRDKV